jgi:hypothetical protein
LPNPIRAQTLVEVTRLTMRGFLVGLEATPAVAE